MWKSWPYDSFVLDLAAFLAECIIENLLSFHYVLIKTFIFLQNLEGYEVNDARASPPKR